MLRASFVSVETIKDETGQRVAWVDIAKGICILLVVMMHSTLGVEKAAGTESGLHGFIEWAKPFRMPDFFFIAGLFLAARINRPWRSYFDTKVVHFAYFYALWLTIHLVLRAGGLITDHGLAGAAGFYLLSYLEPYGTLWFVYMLAVFFVIAKLLEAFPKWLVCLAATTLYLAMPHTGWLVADEFAARFVFFYAGYWLAPAVFKYAQRIEGGKTVPILLALGLWAVGNAFAVADGTAALPGFNLFFGAAGVGAVITISVLLAGTRPGKVIEYCGANSLAIYLAFTVFMAATRLILMKLPISIPLEAVAIACTLAGVCGSLLAERLARNSPASFLFVRPDAFKLTKPHLTRKTRIYAARAKRPA